MSATHDDSRCSFFTMMMVKARRSFGPSTAFLWHCFAKIHVNNRGSGLYGRLHRYFCAGIALSSLLACKMYQYTFFEIHFCPLVSLKVLARDDRGGATFTPQSGPPKLRHRCSSTFKLPACRATSSFTTLCTNNNPPNTLLQAITDVTMISSGFTNAPVSQFLVFAVVIAALVTTLSDTRYYLPIAVVPHIWGYGQLWRFVTWSWVFTNSTEVLFGVLAFYQLRVIERLWGSRKFLVRIVSCRHV